MGTHVLRERGVKLHTSIISLPYGEMGELNSTVSLPPGKEMLVCIWQEASESVRTGLVVASKKKSLTNRESNFGLVTVHASHCLPVL